MRTRVVLHVSPVQSRQAVEPAGEYCPFLHSLQAKADRKAPAFPDWHLDFGSHKITIYVNHSKRQTGCGTNETTNII